MKVLDITLFRETGKELSDAIELAVSDTQRVLIQELPSEILMTQAQFRELSDLAKLPKMYDSKDRLYQTSKNVMEVKVKE